MADPTASLPATAAGDGRVAVLCCSITLRRRGCPSVIGNYGTRPGACVLLQSRRLDAVVVGTRTIERALRRLTTARRRTCQQQQQQCEMWGLCIAPVRARIPNAPARCIRYSGVRALHMQYHLPIRLTGHRILLKIHMLHCPAQVLNLHYQCRRAVFVNTGSTLWTFTVRFLVYFLRTATPSDKTILSLCVTGIQDLRVMQYSAVLSVSLMVTESTPNGDPVECRDGKFVVYCLAPLPCLLVMHNL